MPDTINYITTTTADFEQGTLNDVEAVNDGLELANNPALSFDGVSDYANITHDDVFNPNNNDFTIEALIYPTASKNKETGIANNYPINGTVVPNYGLTYGQYYSWGNGQAVAFYVRDSSSNETRGRLFYNLPNLRQWYHVAGVRQGSDFLLYVNGVLQDSYTNSNIGSPSNNVDFNIGRIWTSDSFEGSIREVRLWIGVARTQTEIQDNMNTELNGDETGLVAYYKTNEGSGTTLTDSAGTNVATINGATWDTTSYYKWGGTRQSHQLDLSRILTVESSSISWQETLNSQTITIETSTDGGSTWDSVTNGGSIPNIAGASTLDVRQTLSTTNTTVTPVLESLEVEIIALSGLFRSQTERLLKTKYIYNLDTERNLFQKKEYYYETKRNLSYLIKLDFDIIRQLQFQMPFLELETLRLLHLSNELQWENKLNNNLEFPVHYWNYIEKMFSQFGTGEHIVTKAYEADNDYLGFADDYDFCWGPETEGEGLPTQQYPDDWEIDDNSQIEYTQKDYGFTEYTQETGRLWGVYVESVGKIFLLKANEDLTGWDRNELMTFAPSGSQKPSIEFNKNGNYEIAVEIKPAGTETREIWLLSPPYADEGIRQICDGRTPHLTLNHDKELVLFYTNQEQTRIFYRLAAESFNTEHEVKGVFEPERQLNLVQSFKVFEKYEVPAPYDVFKSESYGYKGNLIVFYKRDDDYKPYKYALTENLFDYEFIYQEPVVEYGTYKENTALDIDLGIEWLNVVAGELELEDTTNLDISLSIEWLEIEPFILESVESTELDISLGIEWQEIITLTENQTETTNLSVGIDSILWLEV